MKAGRPTYHVKAKWISVCNQDGTSSYYELDNKGNLTDIKLLKSKNKVRSQNAITHATSMPCIAKTSLPMKTEPSQITPIFNENSEEVEIDLLEDFFFSNDFNAFEESYF
ncbi:hypothetical protein GPJ56_008899 [Histomonas meleagridis]|uniref:uncharacterized protein n=1 Tax=Histomonas meleagridis TaxID=135588 RepID=UPI00355A96D1|nr:hypothetical protein GPJ56_008899 [Histomonas meleagridis]KAH0797825.1 hypothetical protein GO595_009454 [Histomonas meleagridis]